MKIWNKIKGYLFYSALVATIISALMNSFIAVNFSGMLKLNIPEIKYNVSQYIAEDRAKTGMTFDCTDSAGFIEAINFVYEGKFSPYKLNSLWIPPYTDEDLMLRQKPTLHAWLGNIGLCRGVVLNANAPVVSPVACVYDEDYLIAMELVLVGEFPQYNIDSNIFGGSVEENEISMDMKRELFFRNVCSRLRF